MELATEKAATVPLNDDGGFTMEFSIPVVEDVAALVDEMMRLSDLGCFKKARKISNYLLARHSSIFAVAAECMRLLHDQGDFQGLVAMTQSVDRDGWSEMQTGIVDLMQAIALTRREQSFNLGHANEMSIDSILELFRHWAELKGDDDDDHAAETLLFSTLHLELWYLSYATQRFEISPLLQLTSGQLYTLVSLMTTLIRRQNFWAANTVMQVCCHPIEDESTVPSRSMDNWPNSRIELLFTALRKINSFTPEGCLNLVTLSQTLCQTLAQVRFYDAHSKTFSTGIAARIRQSLRHQADLLEEIGTVCEYSPRCHQRYQLIALKERAVKSLEPDGLSIQEYDLDQVDSVLAEALVNDDYELQHAISKLVEKSNKPTYILLNYSNATEERNAPHVTLRPMPWFYDWLPTRLPTQLEADESIAHAQSSAVSAVSAPLTPVFTPLGPEMSLEDGSHELPSHTWTSPPNAAVTYRRKSLETMVTGALAVTTQAAKSALSVMLGLSEKPHNAMIENEIYGEVQELAMKFTLLALRMFGWGEKAGQAVETDIRDAQTTKGMLFEIGGTLRHIDKDLLDLETMNSISQIARLPPAIRVSLERSFEKLDTCIIQLEALFPSTEQLEKTEKLLQLTGQNGRIQMLEEELRQRRQRLHPSVQVPVQPSRVDWFFRGSHNAHTMQTHYDAFQYYLSASLDDQKGNMKPNRARDKLIRLSVTQFTELSTDVYDELIRRNDERYIQNMQRALPPNQKFHPKRNQARQKLSTLPTERFRELVTDLSYEHERRAPRFADRADTISLAPSEATLVDNTPFEDDYEELLKDEIQSRPSNILQSSLQNPIPRSATSEYKFGDHMYQSPHKKVLQTDNRNNSEDLFDRI